MIGRYPDVLEANVYGVEVPGYEGRAGCAAITIAPERRKFFDWRGLAGHARNSLPGYAVPVFVRVLDGEIGAAASHNNKQDKVALRSEGIEPSKKGSKVAGGEKNELYWITPRLDRYIVFEDEDWSSLVRGAARL